jgi:CCDC81-like prokaryotic HU domain 1
MYDELYQFLIQHKQLTVPGIGTFLLERNPAQIDFPNKKIDPPSYSIAFHSPVHSPSRKFFNWLANELHLSDREAVVRFNDFVFDMKKQIGEGKIIHWNGVGTLKKGLAGEIRFVSGLNEKVMENGVAAPKVIRVKATHMVRVGEAEKTSTEMTRILNLPGRKKSFAWLTTWGIILVTILFFVFYFSQYGSIISSCANTKKIVPQQATSTYSVLH